MPSCFGPYIPSGYPTLSRPPLGRVWEGDARTTDREDNRLYPAHPAIAPNFMNRRTRRFARRAQAACYYD